jgi:triosephosphate isomerase
MRKKIIAGNWKMYKTVSQSIELAKGTLSSEIVEVVVAPTFTSLNSVMEAIKGKHMSLAAQNMYPEKEGAFTGEISPLMIKDIGCKYVIIGHSERRNVIKESDEFLNKKIKSALGTSLKVIFCIGEHLEERNSGKTKAILEHQLKEGLKGIAAESMKDIVIAYEPVWAIGTGLTATPVQAQEAHEFIRQEIKKMYSHEIADSIQILYGGSVKAENADSLLSLKDIDGVLVGGASLVADTFNKIIKSGEKFSK